ncbi:complement decay-accelerating factor, GPI-anchored isoform X3 [Sebastes fasciatus]|uniref:complement decay-accelerating factor, GPI-anchored isoform X3 n=1 Tax=Sebastes fasciatus TaxID=394691 RepID=UPI003D9E6CD3
MDSSGAFRGGRTTVDRQAAERLGSCLSREVGLKRQNLDQNCLVSFCRTSMDVLLDTCTGRRAVTCLLLLHLLVMKAAAECSKPQGGANRVLTNAALLRNDFPDGLDITLECGHGYVKESGSGIITCVGSIWTELDLNCKRRDCGDPKPQPHMSFNISSGTLYGAVIKGICDKGFQISGSSYRTCYANGWSRGATCEIITCAKPVDVTNGKSSWDSQEYPKYGEIVQYVCNMGYVLIGKDSLTCRDRGRYDYLPPTCEGQTTTEALRITTTMPTSTPEEEEVSIATDSLATPTPTPTAHRATSVTTSATPTVSPSLPGGRGIGTAEGRAITTSVTSTTSSSFPGHMPAIVGVIGLLLVVGTAGMILYKCLLGRKGSYDTREDLKPELLQFQNL